MKVQDFILVGLICATAVLAGLMIASQMETEPLTSNVIAQTNDRSGNYIITTGLVDRDRQGVLIIDSVSRRAIMYLYDPVPRKFVPMCNTTRNLSVDFGR